MDSEMVQLLMQEVRRNLAHPQPHPRDLAPSLDALVYLDQLGVGERELGGLIDLAAPRVIQVGWVGLGLQCRRVGLVDSGRGATTGLTTLHCMIELACSETLVKHGYVLIFVVPPPHPPLPLTRS